MSEQTTRTADARQNAAPVKQARRRGQPWNPAGHLGLPTAQRLAKSNGFDEANLAAGDGPKVPRSAEKMPFTPQAIRIRLIAEEIEAARTSKTPRVPDPQRKLTPLDRALEENEYEALDWLVEATYRSEVGRPASLRYDDGPRGRFAEDGDDTKEKRWRISLGILVEVQKRIPEPMLEFLDTLVHMVHSDFREGKPPSQLEIGQQIIRLQGKDSALAAFRTYARAVAQTISSARADVIIHMKRQKEFREFEAREERKRMAAGMFKAG